MVKKLSTVARRQGGHYTTKIDGTTITNTYKTR